MPEPDPFASPFHPVRLPGQPEPQFPVGFGYPAPMPAVDVPAPSRPAALVVSFWSWLAATALVVVGLPGVFLATSDAHAVVLRERGLAEGDPMEMGEAQVIALMTPLFFAVVFAVLAVPYVVAAVKLRSGRNWARVLLAVLGALGVVFGLLLLLMFAVDEIEYVNWLLGTVWALLFLGAVLLGVVTMFLPPANAYVRVVDPR